MKHTLISALLILFCSIALSAQDNSKQPDRKQWRKEMQQLKVDFMAKELNLSEAQKNEFAPLLTSMDSELESLSHNVREQEKELNRKGEAATEADYRTVSEAMFELRGKESEVEKNYYKTFAKILTHRQLLKIKSAERNFMKVLMTKRTNGPGSKHSNRPNGGNHVNNR